MSEEDDTAAWEAGWEVQFPASTLDEMLLALVVRDLLHGTSFDVEDDSGDMAVDYVAGDELDGDVYRLLVTAEAAGVGDPETLQDITEQLLDQLVEEAEGLIEQRQPLGATAIDDLDFEIVPEDRERWDLVIPDWLAPDGAEVPYGFRPVRRDGGDPWPSDAELDRHGRVIAVPCDGDLHLVAIPAPTDDLAAEPLGEGLPVLG